MQIPFLDSGNAAGGRLMAADKDDRYVLKNCLGYLQLHLRRFPSYSRETCRILVWTLGPDIESVTELMMDQFERKQKQKFKEELLESDLDAEDYANIFAKMLPIMKSKPRGKVINSLPY